MATKRSRWVRISDLMLDEDWDDATLATVVRLLCWMRQRWAREGLTSEEAVEALIPGREAIRITHVGRVDRALVRLESLGTSAGLRGYIASIERGLASNCVRISWPKVAEYQEWATRDTPDQRPGRALSDSRRTAHGARRTEDKRQEKTVARSARLREPPAGWLLKAAESLSECVKRRWPGAKPPESVVGWAHELGKLSSPQAEVESLLAWYVDPALDGESFIPEARAARSFRAKWDALVAARQRRSRDDDADAPLTAERILKVMDAQNRRWGRA